MKKRIKGSMIVKGISLAVLGNVLVSFDSLMVRLADVSGWDTAFWFGLYSFVIMGLISAKRNIGTKESLKSDGKILLLSSVLMTGSVVLLIISVKLTLVANVAVLSSTAPIFAAIFSMIILKEKTRLSTWIAILITIVGIIIVINGSLESGNHIGNLMAITSSAIASLNFVIWRKYKHLDRILVMAIGGLIIALISLGFADPFQQKIETYILLAIMGLITAPWGRLATAVSTKYISAAQATMFRALNTVLAPMWVWVALGEKPTTATFIGGSLIIVTLLVYGLVTDKGVDNLTAN